MTAASRNFLRLTARRLVKVTAVTEGEKYRVHYSKKIVRQHHLASTARVFDDAALQPTDLIAK